MDHVRLFAEVNAAGVRYIVAGRVAVNLHGIPRMTYDLDLAVDPEEENFRRAVRTLEQWGYVCTGVPSPAEAALAGVREKLSEEGVRALRFVNEMYDAGEVDLALTLADSWEDMRQRAVVMVVGGEAVPVMGISDLEETKRRMGRHDDTEDLGGLAVLKELLAGDERALASEDTRYDQIRKFRHWALEKRLEWLVSGRQLRRVSEGGGRGRSPARGKGALTRGRIRGIDHYQDLT